MNEPVTALNMDQFNETRGNFAGPKDSSDVSVNNKEELFEDDDAAVYRRAKASVDELHRARKFEKSIKL